MRRMGLGVLLLVAGLVLAWGNTAQAADDATGTWKWKMQARGGGGGGGGGGAAQEREVTLKLKQEGEKLTGKISGMGGGQNAQDVEIKDGTIKGNELTFKVVRKGRNDQEFTSVYKGKLEGDTIKGKIEMQFGDQKRERDWEAKRAKE